MSRPSSVTNPAEGHGVSMRKFSRGRAWGGGTQWGTRLRCECGWDWKTNEGSPSNPKAKAAIKNAYQRHLDDKVSNYRPSEA